MSKEGFLRRLKEETQGFAKCFVYRSELGKERMSNIDPSVLIVALNDIIKLCEQVKWDPLPLSSAGYFEKINDICEKASDGLEAYWDSRDV